MAGGPLRSPPPAGPAACYRGGMIPRRRPVARTWRRRCGPLAGLAATALTIVACNPSPSTGTYQGYLEAEYVYVASPLGGALESLAVERGRKITAGEALFELDREPEASLVRQAEEGVRQAEARLEDLRKGERPSELAAIEALRDQARSSLALAELELRRVQNLYRDEVVPIDELDRARTQRDLYEAQVARYTAELETARLGGRTDAIDAAEAAADAAKAELTRARWNLDQKAQASPVTGVVHDTLYRPGEWVGPGNPVVVLLPPENLKVRFFVPETELTRVQPGQAVRVRIDGAPAPYPARVSYVSTRAEFTPPVIYSRETRAKLVFMVEARFPSPDVATLRPGQPVDVTLER